MLLYRKGQTKCEILQHLVVLLIRLCEKHVTAQTLLTLCAGDIEVAVKTLAPLFETWPHATEIAIGTTKLFAQLTLPWTYFTHAQVNGKNTLECAKQFEDTHPTYTLILVGFPDHKS